MSEATRKTWLIAPATMDEAAVALGVSRRTLTDWLRRVPDAYERRGVRKVFYPEHIDRLRREMNQCGSKSYGATGGPMLTAPGRMAGGSDALSKLVILAEQRKRARP